jgi:plasmid replication initiation protein
MADVYSAFGNFKQRVLSPAIKEINEYTDITVTYDCITDKGELVTGRLQGKRITHIRLNIENKDTLDRFATYNKTVSKIEKRNLQFKGQLSLNFDDSGKLVEIA